MCFVVLIICLKLDVVNLSFLMVVYKVFFFCLEEINVVFSIIFGERMRFFCSYVFGFLFEMYFVFMSKFLIRGIGLVCVFGFLERI